MQKLSDDHDARIAQAKEILGCGVTASQATSPRPVNSVKVREASLVSEEEIEA